MPPPTVPFADLTASAFAELQDRADRFADAVQAGPVADWAPFLAGASAEVRVPLLFELITIDLEAGWRRGDGPVLEDYLKRFPELGPPAGLPVHVVFEEYRTRTRYGDRPALGVYRTRFPAQFARLEKLAREPGSWGGRTLASVVTPAADGATPAAPPPVTATRVAPDAAAGATAIVRGYELVRWLGGGQFGEVWRARGPGGVEVAVKVVKVGPGRATRDPAGRELAALELVKNLRHPFLLQTHAFWVEDQKLYIVLDLAECSLRDRLEQCQAGGLPGVPAGELIRLAADAAEGLDFLHSRGVFHRDVKPDNLLLMNGHTKVADFGLAKSLDPGVAVSFAGTPAYMAPEVWANKFGPASDQFALAYTYAELRQGRRPVGGDNLVEMVRLLREGTFDLHDIPEPERSAVRRGMAPAPADRFASCSEFVAALAAAAGTGPQEVVARVPPASVVDLLAPPPAPLDWAGSFAAGTPSTMPDGSGSAPILLQTKFDLPPEAARPAPGPSQEQPPRRVPIAALVAGIAVIAGMAVLGLQLGDRPPTAVATHPAPVPPPTAPSLPPPPPPFRPDRPGFAAVGRVADAGGRNLAEGLRLTLPGVRPVDFRLVVPEAGGPPPFYAMERKAWNGLFRAFADANPAAVTGTAWDRAAADDLPAVRVTWAEAAACARWLGGLLPTPAEWDAAAAVLKRTAPPTGAAVGLAAPRSVFDDADRSPAGVFDTAGNGREWTREKLPGPENLVVLRGRMFTLRRPLSAADADAERTDPQAQFAAVPSPYTGFRAVIEPP